MNKYFNRYFRPFFAALITAFLALAVNAVSPICPGGPGCLDTDFGVGGEVIVTSPSNQASRQMLLQSDHKIVSLIGVNTANTIAGYLIRMDADGKEYDSTFGSGGVVTLTWGGASGRVQGIGIQVIGSEQRIVVAGWAPCGKKFCTRVERYTSAGILDGSFGNSGVSTTSTSDASPHMVTILPDQRILINRGVLGMTRLTANGNLDPSFGSNGISTSTSVMYQVRGPAVILPDGRFLIPGTMSIKGSRDLAVGRFNANGSLDSGGRGDSTPGDSFGSGGFATLHLPSTPCFGNDLLVEESGKIIVAGVRGSLPAFIVRFTAIGQLDSSYPINSLDGLTASYFSEMVFQGDGKIVVAGQGQSVDGIPQDALIARYNADGTVDTSFGNNGWILKDYYGVYNWAQSVLMQPDPTCLGCEKILVNGGTMISSSPVLQDVNFIRYLR